MPRIWQYWYKLRIGVCLPYLKSTHFHHLLKTSFPRPRWRTSLRGLKAPQPWSPSFGWSSLQHIVGEAIRLYGSTRGLQLSSPIKIRPRRSDRSTTQPRPIATTNLLIWSSTLELGWWYGWKRHMLSQNSWFFRYAGLYRSCGTSLPTVRYN